MDFLSVERFASPVCERSVPGFLGFTSVRVISAPASSSLPPTAFLLILMIASSSISVAPATVPSALTVNSTVCGFNSYPAGAASSVSSYLPAGSIESVVGTSPDVNETDDLSSLTVSATGVAPCLAVTLERSFPSVDLTVSFAPFSSVLFAATFLLMSAVITSSLSSSFVPPTISPFSLISKSTEVSFV